MVRYIQWKQCFNFLKHTTRFALNTGRLGLISWMDSIRNTIRVSQTFYWHLKFHY